MVKSLGVAVSVRQRSLGNTMGGWVVFYVLTCFHGAQEENELATADSRALNNQQPTGD